MPAFSANLFNYKPSFLSYESVRLTMTSVSSFYKFPYTSSTTTLSRSLKPQTDEVYMISFFAIIGLYGVMDFESLMNCYDVFGDWPCF
jgi:hypothetical protein